MNRERWIVRWTQFGSVGWARFDAAARADALDEARWLFRSVKVRGEHVGLAIRVERERDGDVVMLYNEDSHEIRDGVEPEAEPVEAPPTPLLRAADGVDAGTYVVSEGLTVEAVRERAAEVRRRRHAARDSKIGVALVQTIADFMHNILFYSAVLQTIAADRGPLGDLARAALAAEE